MCTLARSLVSLSATSRWSVIFPSCWQNMILVASHISAIFFTATSRGELCRFRALTTSSLNRL